MRWNSTEKKYGNWHEWYAWHPVKNIHNQWVWLEKIFRKYDTFINGNKRWIYRDIFDMLKENQEQLAKADMQASAVNTKPYIGGAGYSPAAQSTKSYAPITKAPPRRP